tara:strand:- start:522 stop:782 length:261 start_codon:yes stop_codon:yes gene_type:complete
MKFLVAKSKFAAIATAKAELQWEQVRQFEFLDLYRDPVRVITNAAEMRGVKVEVVYLLPSFDDLNATQWEGFQSAFVSRKIKTVRL